MPLIHPSHSSQFPARHCATSACSGGCYPPPRTSSAHVRGRVPRGSQATMDSPGLRHPRICSSCRRWSDSPNNHETSRPATKTSKNLDLRWLNSMNPNDKTIPGKKNKVYYWACHTTIHCLYAISGLMWSWREDPRTREPCSSPLSMSPQQYSWVNFPNQQPLGCRSASTPITEVCPQQCPAENKSSQHSFTLGPPQQLDSDKLRLAEQLVPSLMWKRMRWAKLKTSTQRIPTPTFRWIITNQKVETREL